LKSEKFSYVGTKNEYYPKEEDFSYGFNIYGRDGLKAQLLERILVSKAGFIVDYNYFIQKLKQVNIILIQSENLALEYDKIELDLENRFLYFSSNYLNTLDGFRNALEAKVYDYETRVFELYNSRIYLSDKQFQYLFDPKKKRTSVDLKQRINVVYSKSDWIAFNLDHGPDFMAGQSIENNTDAAGAFLQNYGEYTNFIREYKTSCPYPGDKVLNDLLEKYLGDDVIIPFTIEERKQKFPLAFKELKNEMRKYRTSL